MALNCCVMVVERYPNLKEEAGGSIASCEISSLPNGKLVKWSTALVLWRWHVGPLSRKQTNKTKFY